MSDLQIDSRPRLLEFLLQPAIDPATSVALDRMLLERVVEPAFSALGMLRVYSFEGDVVGLGRYHRTPVSVADSTAERSPVGVHRRLSGGRVWPGGDGFIGLSLILPHRGALVDQPPESLQAYQVLNRYVRGVLETLRGLALDITYPGLDTITARRRPLAWLSMEETVAGALLFEAVVASHRDASCLPAWLDAVDPTGCVTIEMLDSAAVTSIERERGSGLEFDDLAARLRLGFEKQFGIVCEPMAGETSMGITANGPVESLDHGLGGAWMTDPRTRHAVDHHRLGCVEVFALVDDDAYLREVAFVGDFIADSAVMAQLQRSLRGCRVDADSLRRVVESTFAEAGHFLLGVGDPSNLASLLMKAALPSP